MSDRNIKTAMVVGANGLVGSELLSILLDSDYYGTVISVTRKYLDITDERLMQFVIDYDRLEELEELIGADDVYCCLGTTMKKAGSKEKFRQVDLTYPLKIAELVKRNGCKQFLLVSAIGAKKDSSFFYNKVKGELEEEVHKLGFDSLQIFQPSILLGDRNEDRAGEEFAKSFTKAVRFAMIGKLKKYRPIEASHVAKVMFKVAQNNQSGKRIYCSDEMAEL
ncbi:MAG: oxidoreductase [Bacteroidota bacterium]